MAAYTFVVLAVVGHLSSCLTVAIEGSACYLCHRHFVQSVVVLLTHLPPRVFFFSSFQLPHGFLCLPASDKSLRTAHSAVLETLQSSILGFTVTAASRQPEKDMMADVDPANMSTLDSSALLHALSDPEDADQEWERTADEGGAEEGDVNMAELLAATGAALEDDADLDEEEDAGAGADGERKGAPDAVQVRLGFTDATVTDALEATVTRRAQMEQAAGRPAGNGATDAEELQWNETVIEAVARQLTREALEGALASLHADELQQTANMAAS